MTSLFLIYCKRITFPTVTIVHDLNECTGTTCVETVTSHPGLPSSDRVTLGCP